MSELLIALADTAATEDLGRRLCRALTVPAVIYLDGGLGVGKTTLVRALLREAGHQGAVRSPTYTLIEPYAVGDSAFLHLDLYRLADPEELDYLGLRELCGEPATWLVEWPQRGGRGLPAPDLRIALAAHDGARQARLLPRSVRGEAIVEALQNLM